MSRILSVFAVLAICCSAQAQSDYPNKPVRLITPFNPGGAIDIYSRTIGEPLGRRLGQNIIVEAIAGANNPDLKYHDHDAQGYATATVTATQMVVTFNKVKPLNSSVRRQ